MKTSEELVMQAVQRFADKLAQVGELRRLNRRQRQLLQEAAQEIMKLPRQLLQGEHSLPGRK